MVFGSSSSDSSARFLFWPRLWRLMTSVARKATSLSAVTVFPSWNPRVSVAQAYYRCQSAAALIDTFSF
jgi:hypothetical protein